MARATTGIAYATLSLTVLGGMVFTVFLTVPAWSTWQATRDALAEREAEREEHVRFLENLDARLQELQSVERDAKVLGVAFPDTEAPADAIAVLGALAARNGLTISTLTGLAERKGVPPSLPTAGGVGGEATRPGPGGAGRPYEFTAKVRGTYAGLSGFVRDLEKSVRFLDIQSVEFKGGSEDGTITGQFTLFTYVAAVGSSLPSAGPLPSPASPPEAE